MTTFIFTLDTQPEYAGGLTCTRTSQSRVYVKIFRYRPLLTICSVSELVSHPVNIIYYCRRFIY